MIIRKIEPKRYLGLRIIATIIDYTIFISFFFLYVWQFGEKNDEGTYAVYNLMALPILVVWFLYFVVIEAYCGATLGHELVKLTVVKLNGEKPDLSAAFKRHILDIVDIFFYGIPAMITICKTPNFQRLGDLVAGTTVLKKSDIVETEVSFR